MYVYACVREREGEVRVRKKGGEVKCEWGKDKINVRDGNADNIQ